MSFYFAKQGKDTKCEEMITGASHTCQCTQMTIVFQSHMWLKVEKSVYWFVGHLRGLIVNSYAFKRKDSPVGGAVVSTVRSQ